MTWRATYQFFLILISVLFESVRKDDIEACFSLLCMENIHVESFIYFICEHFIIISIAIMVWQNSQKEQDIKTDRFFVILCMADFVDYVVSGNNVWWESPKLYFTEHWFFRVPISMNVLMVVCFLLYAIGQWRTTMNGRQ